MVLVLRVNLKTHLSCNIRGLGGTGMRVLLGQIGDVPVGTGT